MFKDELLQDFEYERRFFCEEFPEKLRTSSQPAFHVQSYYLVSEGYNIRVRVSSSQFFYEMTEDMNLDHILDSNSFRFDNAYLTVKCPVVGGSRYEAEREIDANVGVELILRGGSRIVKNRYSVWIKSDGWVIDVFGGSNQGLIIAECERKAPVIDLEIPEFCAAEVTDDYRFTNDNLSRKPFHTFKQEYLEELDRSDRRFSNQFGQNRYLTDL
ncbi:MAG: hypothetical protein LBC43_00505 [Bifidobacteriaceae bacterium]|jgi:CYTH domain-containing protein|nr:hypothetical protein [Bifidobacteriaceae bacterium]